MNKKNFLILIKNKLHFMSFIYESGELFFLSFIRNLLISQQDKPIVVQKCLIKKVNK
jgi:hypothetical protein